MLVAPGFTALAVAATWPLVPNLGRSLPSDLGDPLFVTWVMAWVGRHLTALGRGDVGAFARMWHAPIFAPEPLTLAYSEHFTARALVTLPVGWLGGTPIAAYNIAFLASVWLSALGAYVFVRSLTGRRDAVAVAGVIYGFNVYRLISLSHLQTLSGQWPPFVLAGLLAFARTGSRPALAGAAAAMVATAWSSLYYLAYFTPLVGLFAALVRHRHEAWRRRGRLAALGLAAATVAALVVPFLLPYGEVQRTLQVARTRPEVEMSSLTLDAYVAAGRHLVPMLGLAAAALALSRRAAAREWRWAIVLFAATGLAMWWLSLGPTPRWHGAPLLVPGPYGWLVDHVPGFSALRVASRMARVLMLALSILAGLGAALGRDLSPRAGTGLAVAAFAVHVSADWAAPFPRDVPVGVGHLRAVPAYLDPAGPLAPIYEAVARLPPTAVVVELPFGEPAYELRCMAAGLGHGRRLLNGYGGVFPPSYRARLPALTAPWLDMDAAWAALGPATHAVVHGEAWAPAQADSVQQGLAGRGARRLAADRAATLWELPPRP